MVIWKSILAAQNFQSFNFYCYAGPYSANETIDKKSSEKALSHKILATDKWKTKFLPFK